MYYVHYSDVSKARNFHLYISDRALVSNERSTMPILARTDNRGEPSGNTSDLLEKP